MYEGMSMSVRVFRAADVLLHIQAAKRSLEKPFLNPHPRMSLQLSMVYPLTSLALATPLYRFLPLLIRNVSVSYVYVCVCVWIQLSFLL